MVIMYELYLYFTNDGSVGLFSPEADDIYHSTYGALSEAYEKFVFPAELDNYFKNYSEIKVLDICYGIGYNTKSFLNFLYEKNILKLKKNKKEKIKIFFNKNKNIEPRYSDNNYNDEIYTNNKTSHYSEQIYSDNNSADNTKKKFGIYHVNNLINNDEIYSNNISANKTIDQDQNIKIYIKALDTDENLFYLSPFFRQGNKKDKKYNKINFHYDKISKLINNEFKQKYTLDQKVNLILFKYIIEKMPEIFQNNDIEKIITSSKYKPFFDRRLCTYFRLIKSKRVKYTHVRRLIAFLHNIYYNHISTSYKKALKYLKTDGFIFDPKVGDARKTLLADNIIYNLIFLDAFTPAKCPALWSLEFFKLLFEHLDKNNGMILTYSNSAAVRNAMINAGFHVGKIYSDELKKYIGTVAVKNKTLIKHELSEYDLGLINSKAGIFYRDENLSGLNEQIIASHKIEVENSDKISSSKFIKQFRKAN